MEQFKRLFECGLDVVERLIHFVATSPATPMLLWGSGFFLAALLLSLALTLVGDLDRVQRLSQQVRTFVNFGFERIDFVLASGAAAVLNNHWRWLWLMLIVLIVGFMGTYAEPRTALVILVAALLWAYMNYRLWASDEEDRAHNVKPEDRRIKLKRHMGAEIAFVALSLLIFFPLIFYQINAFAKSAAYVIPAHYGQHLGYFAYLGAELQRLIPVLRDGELIEKQFAPDIRPGNWIGSSTTFGFRVFGDFLIVSVIIKLFEILSRIRTGVDLRRQDDALNSADMKRALRALEHLSSFVVRYNRLNALGKLISIANPPMGEPIYTSYLRWEACRMLLRLASVRPSLGASMLYAAKDGLSTLIEEAESDRDQFRVAYFQQALSAVFQSLADQIAGEGGLTALRAAELMCRESLDFYVQHDLHQEGVVAQTNLGIVLRLIGERLPGEKGLETLRDAERVIMSALNITSEQERPDKWARLQHNLGTVLNSLGFRLTGDAAVVALRAAERALREALKVITFQRQPENWAVIQNNLGVGQCALGKQLSGEEGIVAFKAARVAFHKALKVYTKRNFPGPWSMAQFNIGNLLSSLGERLGERGGVAVLRAAIVAYREALKIRTEKDLPRDWAMTQYNLGHALYTLAELLDGEKAMLTFRAAEVAYRETLKVFTEKSTPREWASTQNNLGAVLCSMGERLLGQEGLVTLKAAEFAYREALKIRTKDESPDAGAATQKNLGDVLFTLGERLVGEDGMAALRAGETACREALKIRTENASPREWAATLGILGSILELMGERLRGQSGCEHLKEAQKVFKDTLRVITKESYPGEYEEVVEKLMELAKKIAELEAELASQGEDA